MLKDLAYAKINVSLDITGTREDGYHELTMWNLPVDLYDTVYMIESPETEIMSNIALPEKNSLVKALEEARKEFGFTRNFVFVLEKRIPMEAGLGGGTADAASVLRLLKQYFRWDVPEERMIRLAARIGADVPFQYLNRPAITTGIGENLEPVKLRIPYYVLLVKPNSGVSTPQAYKTYDEIGGDHPDFGKLTYGLTSGDLDIISEGMGNSLERASFVLNRQIEPIKEEMRRMGLSCSMMTGSGAAVFALHTSREVLEKAAEQFSKRFAFTKVVRVLGSE